MKKKIILILICVSGILFLNANACLARELEVTYPDLGDSSIRPVSTRALLPETLTYLFNLGISISGIIVFGTLVFGGVKFLTSAGNPVAHSEAISQIMNAFLGGILVLSSFLLLQNINPQLLNPSIGRKVTHQGIVIFKDVAACSEFAGDQSKYDELAKDERALKIVSSVSHLRSFLGENYEDHIAVIYFFEKGEDLEIHGFVEENWIGKIPIAQTQQSNTCAYYNVFAGAKSIKFVPKPAGVYICCGGTYDANWTCGGQEKYLPDTTATLPYECHDKVQGIKLKPFQEFMAKGHPGMPMGEYTQKCQEKGGQNAVFDAQKNTVYCIYQYGVVLHNDVSYKADCEVFTQKMQDLNNSDVIKYNASSATVFEPMNKLYAKGNGVTLFSGTQMMGTRHGPCKQTKTFNTAATFDCGRVINDPKKVNSIEIESPKRYLAVLFEQKNYKGRCEVFIESDPSFVNNDIGRCGCEQIWAGGCHSSVQSLQIYPTR